MNRHRTALRRTSLGALALAVFAILLLATAARGLAADTPPLLSSAGDIAAGQAVVWIDSPLPQSAHARAADVVVHWDAPSAISSMTLTLDGSVVTRPGTPSQPYDRFGSKRFTGVELENAGWHHLVATATPVQGTAGTTSVDVFGGGPDAATTTTSNAPGSSPTTSTSSSSTTTSSSKSTSSTTTTSPTPGEAPKVLGSDLVPGLIYNQPGCGATVATVTLNVVRATTVTITWKHAAKTGTIGATLAGTDTWTAAIDAPTLAAPGRSVGSVEMTITATNASGSEEIGAQQVITISNCKP